MAKSSYSCAEMKKVLTDNQIQIGDFTHNSRFAPILSLATESNDKSLYFQTPEMISHYGISPPYKPPQEKNKSIDPNANYTVELSFEDMEKRQSLTALYDVFQLLSEKVIDAATHNSVNWFNKSYDKEKIRSFFRPNVRDRNGCPSVRCNIPRKNGEFISIFCNEEGKPVNIEEIDTRPSKLTSIIKIEGIWVYGTSFGIHLKLQKMMIKPLSSKEKEEKTQFSFRGDTERIVAPEEIETEENKKKAP